MCQGGLWGGLLGGVGECEGDTESQQVDIDRRALDGGRDGEEDSAKGCE